MSAGKLLIGSPAKPRNPEQSSTKSQALLTFMDFPKEKVISQKAISAENVPTEYQTRF